MALALNNLHAIKQRNQTKPNQGSILGQVTPMTQKMVLHTSLLNIQHHKVLFTNPSARAGYDTRSIFKRSLTGLNSEFSFS